MLGAATRFGAHGRRGQRGLSIVELMVGVTIGLVVVAAAATIMTGQLVENRRLLMEAQIQQDLRAAASIISRDLRRINYLAEVPTLSYPSSLETLDTAVQSGASLLARENTLNNRLNPSSGSTTNQKFFYIASESGLISTDFGYRRSTTNGTPTLKSSLGDLTDSNTVNVTDFNIEVSPVDPTNPTVTLPCPKTCPASAATATSCWPKVQVRYAKFTIKAEGKGINSNIKRQISGKVRLRNDYVQFDSATSLVCPT